MKLLVFSSFFVLLVAFSIFAFQAQAADYTSSNFIVSDPIISSGWGQESVSASNNFKLIGSIGQISIGTSTITHFNVSGGFLYYPYVSTPVVTATAGTQQVALSWTASEGFLGWTVGGYSYGQATGSGGPYSYTSIGSTDTSKTVTGLTAGTKYYFVILPEDAFGNRIATSTEVYATPTAPAATPRCGDSSCNGSETCSTCAADCGSCPGGGGGGGGGGGSLYYYGATPSGGLIKFSGRAYPKRSVWFLKDAQVVGTTVADSNAKFDQTVSNISPGSYIFSVYSEDSKGRRSSNLTFQVSVSSDSVTNVGGIFIAPTIDVDKLEVKKGDNIAILGYSSPNADITIQVSSDEEFFMKTKADELGAYLYNFNTAELEQGDHYTKSKANILNELSTFGKAINFKVGSRTVLVTPLKVLKGDINTDKKVNLVDFSIIAFWYNRPNPPENADLNGDGKVNIVDFSILAFNWTG